MTLRTAEPEPPATFDSRSRVLRVAPALAPLCGEVPVSVGVKTMSTHFEPRSPMRSSLVQRYGSGHRFLSMESIGFAGSPMSAVDGLPEIIVDCPYCNHAWKADPRWISSPCPSCGRMVYRYMDPQHD